MNSNTDSRLPAFTVMDLGVMQFALTQWIDFWENEPLEAPMLPAAKEASTALSKALRQLSDEDYDEPIYLPVISSKRS